MEERNLRGVHSGGSGRDNNRYGGNDTNFSDGGDSVRFNDGHKFEDGSIGDNKS